MPVEPFELIKLLIGIIIIIIPGYLWSFVFFKQLTRLERFVFGFVFGLAFFTCAVFLFNVFFNIKITLTFIVLLFALYAIPAFLFYGLSIYRFGLPKVDLTLIKNKKFIFLVAILGFTFFMMFLPHLSNNYFLPLHVDEWIHWSYSRSVMDSGSTTFLNPYTGIGEIANGEIGFHIATSCLSFLSGTNLLTIFLFMSSIIGIFISLTAYNIGERSKRKFGLEAAFLVGFIPTTIRFLGPSFYVAVTLGLLLLIFIIWLVQIEKPQGALFLAAIIFFMFIVHPQTALAGIIIMFIFSVFLIREKKYKIALLTTVFSFIPIIVAYYFTTNWDFYIESVLQALSGKEYPMGLPYILINFEHLGIIMWVLFVIGIYYSFTQGKALKRAMSFSSLVFIIIIGIYYRTGYGVPAIYERTFLYLFLLVTLIAAVGLSELRKSIKLVSEKNTIKKYKILSKNLRLILPVIISIFLIVIAIPAHIGIPYYQMIDEKEYETFIWIRDNIEDYRDENHSFDRAAIDPFKASPFSAITGLYIVSSSMHPRYGYYYQDEIEQFFEEKCVDTDFLEKHQLSIVYGHCDNEYVNEIYKNVSLYPGVPPNADFIYTLETPAVNDTIYFTSDSTTPYGLIIKYEWDFGDGHISNGETTGLEFDGIDDYVEIQNDSSLDINDAVTIDMWVKPNIKNQKMTAIGKQSAYQIWCSNNTWYFGVYDESFYHGSGYSLATSPIGKWTHVLGVYDPSFSTGQVQIWINGEMENSRDYNGSIRNTDYPFRIGGKLTPWKDVYFNGTIKDVRVYNRALSSTEIMNNYNGDVATNGLVSWWKMNEMKKFFKDSIGNNDGTIHEARWVNHAEHRYSRPGIYQVQLTIWNEDGLDHSISKNITIS